jgi:hypothetical protein
MGCNVPFLSNSDGGGGGADALSVFPVDVVTVDAAPVGLQWGDMPNAGDAIQYEARISGVQSDGSNGQYAFLGGLVAINAAGGPADNSPIAGGNAWTPPGAPWATIAAPGWTLDPLVVIGTGVFVVLIGLAATTIHWRGWIIRSAINGAVLL